jgi:hypothetical protein
MPVLDAHHLQRAQNYMRAGYPVAEALELATSEQVHADDVADLDADLDRLRRGQASPYYYARHEHGIDYRTMAEAMRTGSAPPARSTSHPPASGTAIQRTPGVQLGAHQTWSDGRVHFDSDAIKAAGRDLAGEAGQDEGHDPALSLLDRRLRHLRAHPNCTWAEVVRLIPS